MIPTILIIANSKDKKFAVAIKNYLKEIAEIDIITNINNSLLKEASKYDYSITHISSIEYLNKHFFDIGFFVGRLGLKRSFIIKPSTINIDLFPDRFERSNILTYQWPRKSNNIEYTVAIPCTKIINKISKNEELRTKSLPDGYNPLSLGAIIDNARLGWTLFFVGESEAKQLIELTRLLQKPKSLNGTGKKFNSGFAYWGIGPTLAWYFAVKDIYYYVMHEGIKQFNITWENIYNDLPNSNYHYVSLGAGTGEKDSSVYSSLINKNPNSRYFPIDMTYEMLRIAVGEVTSSRNVKRSKILPIKINFTNPKFQRSIRSIFNKMLEKKPILFSLLGNTLANFEDDILELEYIIKNLLNIGDLLLIELAHSNGTAQEYQQEMIGEYYSSESLRRFHTSALLQNTDLDIDLNSIEYLCKSNKALNLELKIIYKNKSEEKNTVNILGGKSFTFEKNDTIRLYLTRKYTDQGIERLFKNLPLERISEHYLRNDNLGSKSEKFGLATILFKKVKR